MGWGGGGKWRNSLIQSNLSFNGADDLVDGGVRHQRLARAAHPVRVLRLQVMLLTPVTISQLGQGLREEEPRLALDASHGRHEGAELGRIKAPRTPTREEPVLLDVVTSSDVACGTRRKASVM